MNHDATTNNGRELEGALAAWCDLIDRGVNVDRNAFLQQYPAAIQEELSQCLAAFDFIHAAVPHAQRQTLPTDQPPRDHAQPLGGLPFRLGDYEVLEEIGRGGMGVVYRATQISLNRSVAVKILPFAALLDGRQLDRFRNEARAAAMLKHPHIVSVLSVGYEGGQHYYAMELVDGCSLAEVIRATQRPAIERLPADETTPIAALSTEHSADRTSFFRSVARLGIQAANALNVAHEAGIVHRDIKPSNLLLDRDGRLLVADFGLARVQSDKSVTMTGDVVGTLRYMSPEQLQETLAIDHRADIYSLGVTLREMLTGQPTFGSSVRATVITDITNGDVPKLRRIVEDVPRDLETVIGKAMATHVDARYTNAKALEQDLIRFLEGRPVLARRAGTFEILGRWCIRNRSKAALIGLLLTMLFAAAIGGPFAAWKQKQRADAQAAITARQRHEAYDSDMARAHQHVLDGEIENTVELLRQWIPTSSDDLDYRNFEWKYLAAACETRLKSQEMPFLRSVYDCELSPNDEFIAVGSWDGTICCVEVTTHRQVWASTWETGHHAHIHDLCFTADGKYLISSSYDGTIKVWDVVQGNVLLSHDVPGGFVRAMAIARDDELFCCIASLNEFQSAGEIAGQLRRLQFRASNDGNVTLEEIPFTMEEVIPAQTSICLSPDGNLLALGGTRGGVRILNRHTLTTNQHFDDVSGTVRSIEFSPDGMVVAAGVESNRNRPKSGCVELIEVSSGRRIGNLAHDSSVDAVRFDRRGRLITGSGQGSVCVWNISNQRLLHKFFGAPHLINEIATTTDTMFLACEDNCLRRYSLRKLPIMDYVSDSTNGFDVAFSPDSQHVAAGGVDGKLRIFDAATGKEKWMSEKGLPYIWSTAYSPDGKTIASVASPYPARDRCVLLFHNDHGEELYRLELPGMYWGRSVQFVPGGEVLAIGVDANLMLWNVNSENQQGR